MVQGQGIQASQLALLIGDMLKCLDPVYMIWAVPSNASNNLCCIPLCTTFHGARAGYTSFTVGPINRRHAYIPYHNSSCHFFLSVVVLLLIDVVTINNPLST